MEEFEAVSLVIISLGAFILPLVGQRIKIPGIVLEIAYGITVGPVLGWVDSSEFISGIAIPVSYTHLTLQTTCYV